MKAREYKGNTESKPREEKPVLIMSGYRVLRATTTQRGTVMANVEINGITVYGMAVMANRTSGEAFLSWPSTKGKDGKYYSVCYARLSDTDQEAVISSIYDYLDKNT